MTVNNRNTCFVGILAMCLFAPLQSSLAATITWKGAGSGTGSGGSSLDVGADWFGNVVPGTNDNAHIILDRKQDANATLSNNVAFSVMNLVISNLSGRVDNAARTDTVTFNGVVTLSSNLTVGAMSGVNDYTLGVFFSNTVSMLNGTFNGATNAAGTRATATLTFAGATTIKSNLTFNGRTGFAVLNLDGTTTIGRDLTFNGGLGTNILRITSTTTVSNDVSLLNATGSVSNLFVLTGTLLVGGNFNNTITNANKAGFQADSGTITFMGGASRISTMEVASVGNSAVNNYLIGTFQVGNSAGATGNVRLVDGVVNNSGGSEQLLANNFRVFAGSTLDLNGLSASFQLGTNAGTITGITTAGRGLDVSNRFENLGTVVLGGGSIIGPGSVHNAGTITGNGTITPNLTSSGSINVNGAGITFAGLVTNSGNIVVNSSTATFASSVFNSGTINFNPGTAVFNSKLTLGSSGVLLAAPGSTVRFRGDFANGSTQSNAFNLLNTTVIFDGGGVSTQLFTLAGADFGPTLGGYTNNFAMGGLFVGDVADATVQLTGSAGTALYLSNLTVSATSRLILDGHNIYTLEAPSLLGPVDYNGGSIIVIPEPNTLTLVLFGLCGSLVVVRMRRATT